MSLTIRGGIDSNSLTYKMSLIKLKIGKWKQAWSYTNSYVEHILIVEILYGTQRKKENKENDRASVIE
jgi:hypothetical protein